MRYRFVPYEVMYILRPGEILMHYRIIAGGHGELVLSGVRSVLIPQYTPPLMVDIAWIGAGSAAFGMRFLSDILLYPELRDDTTVRLMDIDEERLAASERAARQLRDAQGAEMEIRATTDRKEALQGADYVIVTIWVGGFEPFENERLIPEEYGLKPIFGSQIDACGVMESLRQLPVMIDIARDMAEYCPDAIYMNHTNPIWLGAKLIEQETGIETYGFCHSVPGTTHSLGNYLDVPPEELDLWVAGINHMAWVLELEHDGADLYPQLYRAMADAEIYDRDEVRFELLRHFGAFVTESSATQAEQYPYFWIHGEELRADLNLEPQKYLKIKRADFESSGVPRVADLNLEKRLEGLSDEYTIRFIHSLVTGEERRMNLVVDNETYLIENFPGHAAVDVPCVVDGSGVHPCSVGTIPDHLAALNWPFIAGHELITQSIRQRDPEPARMAVKLDPVTSSVCTLEEIDRLVDDLFDANAEYLPEFENTDRKVSRRAPHRWGW
jgi:alpha-galactosidase